MKKIVFATNNKNKLREINQILSENFRILSLEDIGCFEDVPETQPTIEGNALQKVRYIKDKYSVDCFADDTGLEVDALNGAPGVYSARYAGDDKDSNANIEKLLFEIKDKENRKANFKTVIALSLNGKEYTFEGIVNGKISEEKYGSGGFGYDPVFFPEGYNESFAQMSPETKNKISHRGLAVQKLAEFLLNQ